MTFRVITFSLKHRGLERGSVGGLDTLCSFWLCIQWTQLGLLLDEVYERPLCLQQWLVSRRGVRSLAHHHSFAI